MKLFLSGDVMTGRGIDQILPHPSSPELHESYVRSAQGYVELAEEKNGPIPRPVAPGYIWGDALEALERLRPDARIINLETAITKSPDWLAKGINYRMRPENIDCLRAARIDCCVLANNHILDWGAAGLLETLASLSRCGILAAGAGRDRREAEAPAILDLGEGSRVLVFGIGCESSGVPEDWAAGESSPGVQWLRNPGQGTSIWLRAFGESVRRFKRPGDLAIASIHWGPNWGFEITPEERRLAHALIDGSGIDLVHGHSSHHPRGMELHRGKLILYGCGDLIDDYEGISGYEEFRNDLGLLYFPTLDARDGTLSALELVPTQMHRFRIRRPSSADARWLKRVLIRESRGFEAEISEDAQGTLIWSLPGKAREPAA